MARPGRYLSFTFIWISKRLFPDAKARKDLSKKVIGAGLADDFTERLLGQTQLFGKEFPLGWPPGRSLEMRLCPPKCAQMAFPGQKDRLAARLPARRFDDRRPERVQAGPGLGRYPNSLRRPTRSWLG